MMQQRAAQFGGYAIRPAREEELDAILAIYAYAREQMRLAGNPGQWGTTRPTEAVLRRDLALGNLYAAEREGRLAGVFALVFGDDPTYAHIDGAWPDDAPYATLHRVARGPGAHGLMDAAVAYALSRIDRLRVDTHEDNAPMRHVLESRGFTHCGTILTDDGTPRRAYCLRA